MESVEFRGELHRVSDGTLVCSETPLNQIAAEVTQVADSPLPRCKKCYPATSCSEPSGMVKCEQCDELTPVSGRVCVHCQHPTADG